MGSVQCEVVFPILLLYIFIIKETRFHIEFMILCVLLVAEAGMFFLTTEQSRSVFVRLRKCSGVELVMA